METPNFNSRSTRCSKCLTNCIRLLFWLLCLLTYLIEVALVMWLGVIYVQRKDWVLLSLTLAPLVIPTLILTLVSIVWYWDQDRLFKTMRERNPQDDELQQYKRLIGVWSVPTHLLFLGQVYRYIQLLIFTVTQPSTYDMASLRRDSALLRFLHSFLTSAPLCIVQLYVLLLNLIQHEESFTVLKTLPCLVAMASLCASVVSVLLTLLVYVGSDRLHANPRRVVYPAYLTTFFWHFFMVPSRVGSLALFAVAHGPYIAVVIGVHWIATFIWTLYERTNLCGDCTETPKKPRRHLEIPFVAVLSFIFTFIYFNLREGSTLTRIVIYHLLTSIETIIIASLFYVKMPAEGFAPWAFSFVVGGYILGMLFMALYYAAWHPKRTNDCFMIGIPYSCDCCKVFHKSDSSVGNVDLPLEGSANENVVPINVSDLMTAVPSSIASNNSNGYPHPLQSTPLGHRYLIGGGGARERSGSVRLREREANASPQDQRHSSASQYTHYNHLDPPPLGKRQGTSPSRQDQAASVPPPLPGRRHTWFVRSTAERHSNRSLDTNGIPRGHTRSVHVPRRQSWRLSDSNINDTSIVPTAHLAHFGINNQLYNLPSPIGEEPATPTGIPGGNRNLTATPVVQVNGVSHTHTPINNSPGHTRSASVGEVKPLPLSTRMCYTPIGTRRSASAAEGRIQLELPSHVSRARSFNQNESEQYNSNSGQIYAEIKEFTRGSRYDRSPPRTRQSSVSPTRQGSTRSSRHGSPRAAQSVNTTPKHSPYTSHRRSRHSSNPLHTHDPMQEFTKLYSTTTHGNYGVIRKQPRTSSSPTGDDTEGSQRAASTSSSHLISSDNYSDAYIIDDNSTESGRATRKSSQHSDASSIPISACTSILSSPSLPSRNPHLHFNSNHMTSRTDRMTCQSDAMLLRPTLPSSSLTGTLV